MTNQPFALGIRICLTIALLFSTYAAIRQGIGAYYFRRGRPEDVQNAIRLDPQDPEYPDASASLIHFYSDGPQADVILQLYETSVRLSPYDARYRVDLGSAYDWAGRPNDALNAFTRALELFPNSPDLYWKFANFQIRQGRILEGLHALRKVLLDGTIPDKQVFVLAARATRDGQAILNEMLPPRAPMLIDYLNYQLEAGRIDAAKQTWGRLVELHQPFAVRQAFPYLDALIERRDLDALATAWGVLCQRFPSEIQPRMTEGNLITNGTFQSGILNGGLDWRITPVEGVNVSFAPQLPEGHPSLRIEFDGTRNFDYAAILQIVPVKPSRKYLFSARFRLDGITTDSGPRFEIFDLDDTSRLFVSTENLVGTTAESEQRLEFSTKPETKLLIVRIARPPSRKFGNKISGVAWIDNVRLSSEN